MEADIIITIALVAGAVLAIAHIGRILRTYAMQRTIREAIHTNSDATPVLLERIDDLKSKGPGDDRIATVLLALGAAILGYGLIAADPGDATELAGMSLFPIFVGLGLLARLWVIRRRGGVA